MIMYDVVKSEDLPDLTKRVTNLLAIGWTAQGGIAMSEHCGVVGCPRLLYAQAITKVSND